MPPFPLSIVTRRWSVTFTLTTAGFGALTPFGPTYHTQNVRVFPAASTGTADTLSREISPSVFTFNQLGMEPVTEHSPGVPSAPVGLIVEKPCLPAAAFCSLDHLSLAVLLVSTSGFCGSSFTSWAEPSVLAPTVVLRVRS